jgi:hypothetical protein
MGEDMPRSAFVEPSAVHSSMRRAELAWRRELAVQTVADIRAEAHHHAPAAPAAVRRALVARRGG